MRHHNHNSNWSRNLTLTINNLLPHWLVIQAIIYLLIVAL